MKIPINLDISDVIGLVCLLEAQTKAYIYECDFNNAKAEIFAILGVCQTMLTIIPDPATSLAVSGEITKTANALKNMALAMPGKWVW